MRDRRKIAVVLVTIVAGAAAGFMLSLTLGPGWRAYTIEGVSMEPAFSRGDLIITSIKSASEVEPGQTAVYTADWVSRSTGGRVAHRVAAVVRVGDRVIAYTQGDANLIADPEPVDITDGVRIVTHHIPSGGMWARLVGTPFVIAVLSTLGAGLAGAVLSSGMPVALRGIRQLRGVPQERAY